MYLDEVRSLKDKATEILNETLAKVEPFGTNNSDTKSLFFPPAFGIHQKSQQDYQLAVRLAYKRDIKLIEPILSEIPKTNIDLRITGPIIPFSQPLSIGVGVTHRDSWITGKGRRGTLGCFVRKRGCSELLILSNNHILANLNTANKNDPIIFCGKKSWSIANILFNFHPFSRLPRDNEIGFLEEYIPLKYHDVNLVDAAIATVKGSHKIEHNKINKLNLLKGFHKKESFEQRKDIFEICVSKVGIATGLTKGNITAFNIPQRIYYYSEDKLCDFVELFEIQQPKGCKPFAKPGDSGAIIFDQDGYAVALLFSGTRSGSAYAIPISTVLEKLDIELALN